MHPHVIIIRIACYSVMEIVSGHKLNTKYLEKPVAFDEVIMNEQLVDETKTGGLRNAVKDFLFPDLF